MENRLVGFGARSISRSGLVPVLETLEVHRANLLRILVYHRIGNPAAEDGLLDPTLVNATTEQFEQQMRFLRENYRLLSIVDLLRAIENREPLPPKSIMVTFDDGYRCFGDSAWPVLERYQIPALMFLATGYLSASGQMFWWDRLYQGLYKTRRTRLSLPQIGDYPLETEQQRWAAFIGIKRQIRPIDNPSVVRLLDQIVGELDVAPQAPDCLLTWSDVRSLHARGCFFAAHTRNHPILSRIPAQVGLQEIRDSQQDIIREIGAALPVVAYPSGHASDCSAELTPLLGRDGFKLAMSSIPGINVLPRQDLYRLKRIGLSPRVSMSIFRMVLTSAYRHYCTIQEKIFHKG